MANLYPTKTRLALLQAIVDGEVVTGIGPRSARIDIYQVDPQPPHESTKVTSRVHELARAGWIRLDDIDTPTITDLGCVVLDARRGSI